MAHWVLASHPGRVRVLDSVLEQAEEWWLTGGRPLARGDRVAIWKYKGRELRRGVVALGEVLTDPVDMDLSDGSNTYWLNGADPLTLRAPRVRVRYVRAPGLPLWWGHHPSSVVDDLPVARARGGTAFRVSDEQWRRLVEEAGGWPEASPDVADDAADVEDIVRRRSRGQTFITDSARRRAIELHAVEVVIAAYRAKGWSVTDVSASSPYDLHCERDDEVRRVEVKGTSGSADAVLLTSNEVTSARSDPASAVLAVVHGISLTGDVLDRVDAEGGELLLIEPWDVDQGTLTPIAYRYLLGAHAPPASR
jgi:hypothetical protein